MPVEQICVKQPTHVGSGGQETIRLDFTLQQTSLAFFGCRDDGFVHWEDISIVSVAFFLNFKQTLNLHNTLNSDISWWSGNHVGHNKKSHFIGSYFTVTHARTLKSTANDCAD
jgi:hypothetical protein